MIAAIGLSLPSSAHFIYIPAIFIIGIVLGFILGSKATRDAFALEERKAEERAARKAAREATRQAQADKDQGHPPAAKES